MEKHPAAAARANSAPLAFVACDNILLPGGVIRVLQRFLRLSGGGLRAYPSTNSCTRLWRLTLSPHSGEIAISR